MSYGDSHLDGFAYFFRLSKQKLDSFQLVILIAGKQNHFILFILFYYILKPKVFYYSVIFLKGT